MASATALSDSEHQAITVAIGSTAQKLLSVSGGFTLSQSWFREREK